MTKFEQIGVNYQMDSTSKQEAVKCFKFSCNCCCNKGIRIDCDRCQIAQVHYQMMAAFDTLEQMKEEKKNNLEIPKPIIVMQVPACACEGCEEAHSKE